MITGEKRESQFDDGLFVGLFKATVVKINPEENSKGEEIKYLTEKEGVKTMRITITLKEVDSGKFFNASFFLKDKPQESRNGNTTQYINSVGWTMYTDSPDNLSNAFKEHAYHVARQGEEELVRFIDAWLDIDRKQKYNLEFEWEQLMKGNVKEIRDLMKSDLPREVLAVATVRVQEKDGEIKEYQDVYNRKFLPGYNMKFFKSTSWTPDYIEKLRERFAEIKRTKEGKLKVYEKFMVEITDKEHGIKDHYYPGILRKYDSTENVAAGSKIVVEDDLDY